MAYEPSTRLLVRLGVALAAPIVAIALLVATGRSLPIPGRAAEPSQAQLEIAQTAWDVGPIEVGRTVLVRVPVANRGDVRLDLREAGSSCSCVYEIPRALLVPAGETRELILRVDTRGMKGPVRLDVNYRTNDPQRSSVELSVVADVVIPG